MRVIVSLIMRSHKPANITLALFAGVMASAAACAHAAGAAAARESCIFASRDSLLPCREMVNGALISVELPARDRASNGGAQLQGEVRSVTNTKIKKK